jgi:FliI/YscN family ATPase
VSSFARYGERLRDVECARLCGRVRGVVGLVAEIEGLAAPIGGQCEIRPVGAKPVRAEVVGFRGDATILMPLGELDGVRRGDDVALLDAGQSVRAGDALLGRVIDSLGEPLDGRPAPEAARWVPVHAKSPGPLERPRITEALETGVRAIDAMHTLGRGQRVGLFSGSGVGKSVLLGMIARHTKADVVVAALVGERGREVREFIERDLGDGLARSVVVVETADRPALLRARTASVATAVAEHFRDEGKNVLLLVDSLTRVAAAQREIGLSAGEPPATKGYPPSVFAALPRLLERAGRTARGSITGVYTVLVEGDDLSEPVADAARSVLDGHLVLSRAMAMRGVFPAVDPLASVSRVMDAVADASLRQAAARAKSILASYRGAEEMIAVGAYKAGTNAEVDKAVRLRPAIEAALRQGTGERSGLTEATEGLSRALYETI